MIVCVKWGYSFSFFFFFSLYMMTQTHKKKMKKNNNNNKKSILDCIGLGQCKNYVKPIIYSL